MGDSVKPLPVDHMKLDDKTLKIIDKAMVETFSAFLGVTPQLKRHSVTDENIKDSYDISGAIVFLQGQIEATLFIRLHKESLFKLLGPLLRGGNVRNQQSSRRRCWGAD